ncbi:dihydroxyacetone kinase DhaL subunit [Halanaerobium saccharolyticum]|uniref:phosphoenolpyruvate--glycerone phosphotransferase n=2 Tax=Halanaerobium saccharolyticum TaxID=43595 RepID=A0A4R7Z0V8_9FIRM|nr:dihydroxyacetone kinase subunit DhaL [Halanaerobium saccharolyticum]RAK07424.1 dihydroxyacetone kinase DhaL subunit [Halanaerobium saccharolyticum]TDW02389.1 dihydroxyacetone kinase DhaL subunit [Halanaerobium saccharolyticum]TDX59109.1 dihydroxyacetone kinase DhaL subunit [Halanaerobium saccharolyticum]
MANKTKKILLETSDVIIENKEYLTELDAAIGDGDHGINLARGFKKLKEKLENETFTERNELFKLTAMTLISNVGGASGPLYGTAFLNISKVISDERLDLDDLVEIAEEAIAGIQKRGKAEAGEKTMLDTIIPAAESLKQSRDNNLDLETALNNCLETAAEGMKNTIEMQATKGRASYLGERSIGHQDPGATSAYLMIKTFITSYL